MHNEIESQADYILYRRPFLYSINYYFESTANYFGNWITSCYKKNQIFLHLFSINKRLIPNVDVISNMECNYFDIMGVK